ncbi:hypothetical protein D3C80_1365820 [compost metagenome]
MTCSAMTERLSLTPLFCSLNWLEIELKRLLRACALVMNSCREASSVGLDDTPCRAVKKPCSAPEIPVLLSLSNLSTWVIWFRKAVVSLSREVLVCNWLSRKAL